MSSLIDVLDEPIRARIAEAARSLSGGATSYQLAKAVGRRSGGDIRDPLETLVRHRVLVVRKVQQAHRQKTVYDFNDKFGSALDRALARVQPGQLDPGARAILVAVSDLAAVAIALRESAVVAQVGWLAELDDSTLGALLVLSADAGPSDVTRLLEAFRAAGAAAGSRTVRLRVSETVPVEELDAWIDRILPQAPSAALGE